MVVKGLNNREIGTLLHISSDTVKSHVSSLLNKLSVTNRIQITAKAVREGLA